MFKHNPVTCIIEDRLNVMIHLRLCVRLLCTYCDSAKTKLPKPNFR